MSADLFLSRVRVKIADLSHSCDGIQAAVASEDRLAAVQRAALEIDGRDVSAFTKLAIDRAFSNGISGPGLLQAFWEEHHALGAQRDSYDTQLLVNPPAGLDVSSSGVSTASYQDWLGGKYGLWSSKRFPSVLDLMALSLETDGFFDSIVVFWDFGVDPSELASRVIPGSVVTLVRPNKRVHGWWLDVAGLDLSFSGMMEELENHFVLKLLSASKADADVQSTTFGIEAK